MTDIEQLWKEFQQPLLRFIRSRVADQMLAEDILQDVFLKVQSHIHSLRDHQRIESWLYQLTRNAIIDQYRRSRPMHDVPHDLAALSDDDDANQAVQQLLPAVRLMVEHLPPIYREALILTEYEGLTQKELAERLDISLSGAKSRVQRARQQLKEMLLECCHFELDRRNAILAYHPRADCCDEECEQQ